MTEFQVSHTVRWAVEGTTDSVPSILRWTSEDPLAVQVNFGQGGEDDIEWKFARDLLADVVSGKYDQTGQGDIHVARRSNHGISGSSGDHLVLTLTVGTTVRLRTELEEIRIFLQNTYMYAPQGKEILDMDAAIDKLLDGGWASGV